MARDVIAGLPAKEYYRQYRKRRSQDPAWRARRTELSRDYRQRNPERTKRSYREMHLRKKYGITLAQYEAMVEAQGGGCAACGGPPTAHGVLHVDHDHACCAGITTCGQCVRGLLCSGCNVTLGNVKDSPGRLRLLIAYLETHGQH